MNPDGRIQGWGNLEGIFRVLLLGWEQGGNSGQESKGVIHEWDPGGGTQGTDFGNTLVRFVSGWQRLRMNIFNESEMPHVVVGPMRQRSGGWPNASPTVEV